MPGRCKLRIAPPASSGNWRAIQAKPPLAVSFSSISSLFKSIEGIRASVRAVASGSTIACGSAYTETAATLDPDSVGYAQQMFAEDSDNGSNFISPPYAPRGSLTGNLVNGQTIMNGGHGADDGTSAEQASSQS